jgi:hypothetical protein
MTTGDLWRNQLRIHFPDWGTPRSEATWRSKPAPIRIDDELTAEVVVVAEFGVWLDGTIGVPILLLAPYMSDARLRPLSMSDYPPLGTRVRVRVRSVGIGEVGATQLESVNPGEPSGLRAARDQHLREGYDPTGDRSGWEAAWRVCAHRRLVRPPKIPCSLASLASKDPWQEVTVSEDPAQFAEQMAERPDACPVCGSSTFGSPRRAASLHWSFASGFNYGQSIWIHELCWLASPVTERPPPIPW